MGDSIVKEEFGEEGGEIDTENGNKSIEETNGDEAYVFEFISRG